MNTGKQRKTPKHWRKFGQITVTGIDGKSKIVREEAYIRIHSKTGHCALDNHDIKKAPIAGQAKEKGALIIRRNSK